MPLYEYECPRTGKRFEEIQKFSDDPITCCPDCDEHPDCDGEARKLLSAPAIQFKGAGWYVNDYGKGGKLPKKEGGESKDSKTKSDKDSKSDSNSSKSDSKKTDSSSSKTKKS